MYLEVSIVGVLTLIHTYSAMSELAIVAVRTARLKLGADHGSKGATTAIRPARNLLRSGGTRSLVRRAERPIYTRRTGPLWRRLSAT